MQKKHYNRRILRVFRGGLAFHFWPLKKPNDIADYVCCPHKNNNLIRISGALIVKILHVSSFIDNLSIDSTFVKNNLDSLFIQIQSHLQLIVFFFRITTTVLPAGHWLSKMSKFSFYILYLQSRNNINRYIFSINIWGDHGCYLHVPKNKKIISYSDQYTLHSIAFSLSHSEAYLIWEDGTF